MLNGNVILQATENRFMSSGQEWEYLYGGNGSCVVTFNGLSGPGIDCADAFEALKKPAAAEGVLFEEAALSQIYVNAHGYPFFLQEWGYHAWNVARQSPISFYDIHDATEIAINRLDQGFFRVRFDRLTPREKSYLRAMASLGPGPFKSGEVATVLGKKSSSLGPLRDGLISKGMIYSPAYGDIAFTVPLFDEFMKRIMPIQQDRIS